MNFLMFSLYVVLSIFLMFGWVQTEVEISTFRLVIATVCLAVGWLDLFTGWVSGYVWQITNDCFGGSR